MEKIKIDGMSCQHCVQSVKTALEQLGLSAVNVDLESGTATFAPTTAFSTDQLTDTIEDIGFDVINIE